MILSLSSTFKRICVHVKSFFARFSLNTIGNCTMHSTIVVKLHGMKIEGRAFKSVTFQLDACACFVRGVYIRERGCDHLKKRMVHHVHMKIV
jgi:hypothetical protein